MLTTDNDCSCNVSKCLIMQRASVQLMEGKLEHDCLCILGIIFSQGLVNDWLHTMCLWFVCLVQCPAGSLLENVCLQD